MIGKLLKATAYTVGYLALGTIGAHIVHYVAERDYPLEQATLYIVEEQKE